MQLVKKRSPRIADTVGKPHRPAGAPGEHEEHSRVQQPQCQAGSARVQQIGATVPGESQKTEAELQENQEQQPSGRREEFVVRDH